MGSTITRKSSDHRLAAAATGLLDARGEPARDAPRLIDWRPAAPLASNGRWPAELPPAPRGLCELSAAFLRVTGPDRESWLQGVQTADVRDIPVLGAGATLFLNSRGRTLAPATIWRLPEELVISVPPAQAGPLREHLDRLLIMEDAELSGPLDGSGLHALRLAPGEAAELLAALPPEPRERLAELRGVDLPLGFEVLVSDSVAAELRAAIPEHPEVLLADAWRIALGVPAWGIDFDADSTPLEAGLDAQIAFDKGCYVGQEVIAMATYRGRVPWNLVRLELEGPPPAAGTPLDVARGGKGKITSAAPIGPRSVALGVVHREKAEPGAAVGLADDRIATVLGLPFGSRPGAGTRG